jgi:molybdate transport repressor ModE-like protein
MSRGPSYKELTLQQLRSFCETARRGSLKAAAEALELSHPTVWQQVHALERQLGARLIEPHGRGCRLTGDGRLLADMAGRLVAEIESLGRSFAEARGHLRRSLTVATTQRTLVEDLPEVVVAFDRAHPDIQLRFLEVRTEDVLPAVESRAADLGVTSQMPRDASLAVEPGYELDLKLVTPRDHPLARRRRITPDDLRRYPWVNTPESQPSAAVNEALRKLAVFRTEPRRIEARYTATVRRYVQLGFGIGLVVGLPSRPAPEGLHERSMSRRFGRIAVNLVWREGVSQAAVIQTFAAVVRRVLGARHRKPVRRPKRRKSAGP